MTKSQHSFLRGGRLRLEGGRWPGFRLLELSATGMLIEAPAEPNLPIGTVRAFEIDGLHGTFVAESAHTDPASGKTFYTIKVIEDDPGVLDAIARGAASQKGVMRRVE